MEQTHVNMSLPIRASKVDWLLGLIHNLMQNLPNLERSMFFSYAEADMMVSSGNSANRTARWSKGEEAPSRTHTTSLNLHNQFETWSDIFLDPVLIITAYAGEGLFMFCQNLSRLISLHEHTLGSLAVLFSSCRPL
jgi:hypothetical protein